MLPHLHIHLCINWYKHDKKNIATANNEKKIVLFLEQFSCSVSNFVERHWDHQCRFIIIIGTIESFCFYIYLYTLPRNALFTRLQTKTIHVELFDFFSFSTFCLASHRCTASIVIPASILIYCLRSWFDFYNMNIEQTSIIGIFASKTKKKTGKKIPSFRWSGVEVINCLKIRCTYCLGVFFCECACVHIQSAMVVVAL